MGCGKKFVRKKSAFIWHFIGPEPRVIVKFQMAVVNPTALASDNEVIDMLMDAVRLLVIKENVEPWPLVTTRQKD